VLIVSRRGDTSLHSVLRSLRALALFARVLLSYLLQWALWRGLGERRFGGRWQRVHQKNARRLATGFTHLRGVYIKLGQVISVLGTFLPLVYSRELERLQDAVPPQPFSRIKRRLEDALGSGAMDHFIEFEKSPVAAASLAQVHRAKTRDQRTVAVKVLYPEIETLMRRDLWTIRLVVPWVQVLFGFKKAGRVVDQLAAMLEHETDFDHERQNMERVRQMFSHRSDIVVPTVVESLSRRTVLIMSFEEGVKLTDVNELQRQGIDPSAVASTIAECYLSMLLDHHVFHADPHPGNLLARPGNQLVLLDYGAVEPISPALVSGIKKVMTGGLAKNADLVIAGIEEMGFIAEDGDRTLLERVGREYLAVLADVKVRDFARIDQETLRNLSGFGQLRGRLRAVASSLQYPDGYFYVERTIALLFGLVGKLAPERGLLGVAAPHAAKALMKGLRPPRPSASA
jgi:ubiquinone biosynthesis protein